MKTLRNLTALGAFAILALAQTARYPTNVVTDQYLKVAKDRAQTTLNASLNSSATSFTVVSGSKFAANIIITIDSEQISVCGVSGGTFTVGHSSCPNIDGRGFGGTSAASHANGVLVSAYMTAYNYTAQNVELKAIETALGANLANITALIPNPTPVANGGTNATTASGARTNLSAAVTGANNDITSLTALSTPLPVNEGGTAATTAAGARAALSAAVTGANNDITSLTALSTPVPVAGGGTGVTAAQGTGDTKVELAGTNSGVTGAGLCNDANGGATTSGCASPLPTPSSQLQYLRTKPNAGNNTTTEFAGLAVVNAADYNWAAQSPGGSLIVGNNTITLTPCPLGVLWTDNLLRFYISGGTGTAESVPVLAAGPGTCTSGATTGTITITAANTHSGAWTIRSSSVGIYEAQAANPFRRIYIPAARYTMRDCLVFPTSGGIWLEGDNYDINFVGGTILDFASVGVNCGGAIQVTAFGGTNTYNFRNLQLWGADSTAIVTSPIAAFAFTGPVRITLSHVATSAFYYGVRTIGAFEVSINEKSNILYSVCNGVQATGLLNILRITDSYVGFSGRVSGGGCGAGIYIVGDAIPSESTNVLLDGVDVSGSGSAPFAAQVITAAPGLYAQNLTGITVANSYFEANVAVQQVQYVGGISSLTEYGNWFNGVGSTNAVIYASDTYAVNSFNNIFYSATGTRSLPSDLSNWVLGPDTCLNTSAECTTHQHYLGHVSKLVTTSTFTNFQAANYIATESGSNNAIAGALLDASGTAVPLAAGLLVRVKLAHTLQAGANTFVFNSVSKNIKSHLNIANNIGTAYAATGMVALMYDGTQWVDVSQ